MTARSEFRPRTLSERIDYWFSLKNWPWMFRMHALMYRLSGGRLGAVKRDIPVLLLTTTGRRSGEPRTVPLMYLADGNRFIVVGSNAGLDRDPDWCFNLRQSPRATVQVGAEETTVAAREASNIEREDLWPRVVELNPFYQGFQERTSRTIPIVVLEPESS